MKVTKIAAAVALSAAAVNVSAVDFVLTHNLPGVAGILNLQVNEGVNPHPALPVLLQDADAISTDDTSAEDLLNTAANLANRVANTALADSPDFTNIHAIVQSAQFSTSQVQKANAQVVNGNAVLDLKSLAQNSINSEVTTATTTDANDPVDPQVQGAGIGFANNTADILSLQVGVNTKQEAKSEVLTSVAGPGQVIRSDADNRLNTSTLTALGQGLNASAQSVSGQAAIPTVGTLVEINSQNAEAILKDSGVETTDAFATATNVINLSASTADAQGKATVQSGVLNVLNPGLADELPVISASDIPTVTVDGSDFGLPSLEVIPGQVALLNSQNAQAEATGNKVAELTVTANNYDNQFTGTATSVDSLARVELVQVGFSNSQVANTFAIGNHVDLGTFTAGNSLNVATNSALSSGGSLINVGQFAQGNTQLAHATSTSNTSLIGSLTNTAINTTNSATNFSTIQASHTITIPSTPVSP